jgi:hypothetical protein
MTDQVSQSVPSRPAQDPQQQPGGDPNLDFGPTAPSMAQYFLGYALVFGLIISFALAVVVLMRLLR